MSGIKLERQHKATNYVDGIAKFIIHVNGKDIYKTPAETWVFIGRQPKHFHRPIVLTEYDIRMMPNDHFWTNVRTVLAMRGEISL